jgi:tRNA 5-methylaminomethyl-2-thiouridine biosynthesis bifunctional protein
MNKQIYDTIVIGAGIAGCMISYMLKSKGYSVLLVDRSAVPASGGSGAAGAFVSPKIGKGSILQSLTNEAYQYAVDFYSKNFSEHFYQTGIIRIPKDDEDAKKFTIYEQFNDNDFKWIKQDELNHIGIYEKNDGFFFEKAGVCDAPSMCKAIWEQVEFLQFEVIDLYQQNDIWTLSNKKDVLKANKVVIATGYESNLLPIKYMGLRGTWGSRGDYYSKLKLNVSMHKKISISANINGIIKLGATHNKAKEPCKVCDGYPLRMLENEAKEMIDSSDLVLKETFCGMRAGSKDYFPLVGKIVDTKFMLENYPKIKRGAKEPLKHLRGMYIFDGFGGRGFVFAPLMAQWLSEHIINDKEIDSRVNPDRLFLKWCRKAFI